MALIQFNFKSQSVGRNVNVTIVLPTDGLSFYDPSEAERYGHNPITKVVPNTYQPGMKFQTVYVYHGGGEDNSVTYRYVALERAAQENKVMLVCPDIQFFGTDCAGETILHSLLRNFPA